MGISNRTRAQLSWEVQNINNYLEQFYEPDNGDRRLATLGGTGEYIIVRNLPFPDWLRPDYADVLLIVDSFPARPPIGLHVLNNDNEELLRHLKGRANAFRDGAFHGAQAIPGYTWICYHYRNNSWRYRGDVPSRGDNIQKFLESFYAELKN